MHVTTKLSIVLFAISQIEAAAIPKRQNLPYTNSPAVAAEGNGILPPGWVKRGEEWQHIPGGAPSITVKREDLIPEHNPNSNVRREDLIPEHNPNSNVRREDLTPEHNPNSNVKRAVSDGPVSYKNLYPPITQPNADVKRADETEAKGPVPYKNLFPPIPDTQPNADVKRQIDDPCAASPALNPGPFPCTDYNPEILGKRKDLTPDENPDANVKREGSDGKSPVPYIDLYPPTTE